MGNTYSQIFIQLIFAVKGRERQICEEFRERLEKYITGIIQNNHQKTFSYLCKSGSCSYFNWLQ